MAVWNNEGKMFYEGCVLRTWERNSFNDSDFYADCVNVETGEIDTVEYDATRFAGGGYAEVDITAENYRKYLRKAYARLLLDKISRNRSSAKVIEKGKEVIVKKGRKVPIGVRGKVFWVGEVNYDPYRRWFHSSWRIGIVTDDGEKYFTAMTNCEVAEPTKYYTPVRILGRELKASMSRSYLEKFGGAR